MTGYLPEIAGKDDYQILHYEETRQQNENQSRIHLYGQYRQPESQQIQVYPVTPLSVIILQKYSSLNYQPFNPVIFLLHQKDSLRSISGAFPGNTDNPAYRGASDPPSEPGRVRHCTVRFQHSVIQSVFFLPPETEDDKSPQLWLKPVPDV